MIQMINVILSLTILLQLVYLFTCGQPYMFREAKRAGINEYFFKILHLIGVCAAIINAVLSDKNTIWETFMYGCVVGIFAMHVKVAKKLFNRAKNGSN